MKIHAVTIDTANPQKLAAWWSQALGIAVANDFGMIVQLGSSPDLPPFQFQKVEDVPTQRNRVHVDLRTSDLDGETERLVRLGATVVQKFELPQIRYTTLTDPDGNTFDLVQE
ncbi:VOC family protein [Agrobacterium larrymoorei]|uniref:VOC family protein n=1 Tax=Agrobacterium larrymoorei TaxID=160699 RepID=A0A4D7DUZ2_9HYPH|nr:VOC family protein [Agrobacterium larrymoorei]QCJ00924.1 VOC family protein [Agrobacterium larrymoorei]QYA10258.1 VOC family protein [Agrobacterium larrymoorei]